MSCQRGIASLISYEEMIFSGNIFCCQLFPQVPLAAWSDRTTSLPSRSMAIAIIRFALPPKTQGTQLFLSLNEIFFKSYASSFAVNPHTRTPYTEKGRLHVVLSSPRRSRVDSSREKEPFPSISSTSSSSFIHRVSTTISTTPVPSLSQTMEGAKWTFKVVPFLLSSLVALQSISIAGAQNAMPYARPEVCSR